MNKTSNNNQVFIDPVCCMKVSKKDNDLSYMYKFRTYYFCAEGCRKSFERDPDQYLNQKPKRKGLWGRYLERLEKTTGGKSLNCH